MGQAPIGPRERAAGDVCRNPDWIGTSNHPLAGRLESWWLLRRQDASYAVRTDAEMVAVRTGASMWNVVEHWLVAEYEPE